MANDLLKKYYDLLNPIQQTLGNLGRQVVQNAPQIVQAAANPVGYATNKIAQQPQVQNFVQNKVVPQVQNLAQNQMNKPIAPYAPSLNQVRQFNQGLNDRFNGGKTGAEMFAQGLVELSKPGDLSPQAINAGTGFSMGTINPAKGQKLAGLLGSQGGKLRSGKEALDATAQLANKESIPQQIQLPPKIAGQKAEQSGIPNGMDDILKSGYEEIGSLAQAPKKTLGQKFDEFYTNWVDRFNPIVKAAQAVENKGKAEGFMLRPENNPRYTLKKFLGMGGIAEQRFNTELKPVLDQIDQFKIPQQDMDLYLKSRRDINLGQRGIQGSDSNLGSQRAQILESKHPELKQVADQLYAYQSKGFKELADSGFFSPEVAQSIQNTNADYVPFQRVLDQLDEYLGIPSRSVQQSTNPVKGIKGSDKQIYSPIESIIANTFKQRAAIEKNNVTKSIAGLAQAMPELGFKPVTKSGSDTITFWQNGQKVHYQVGEDIANAAKGLNEENMNSFLKILEYPASILRQGATGRNPDFMIPNMVKDQFDAATNSQYGYTPFLDWAKGLAHMVQKDDVYQAWINSGGSQTMSSMSGRKGIQEMLSEKDVQKRIIPKLFGWLGKGIDAMGNLSEQPTRVGLFANAYKKTGNPLIGAMESREGTLDFSRMGAKMKVANSIVPFLNVGIQGFDKMIRTAKSNPAKFAFNMSLYGAMPAITTTLYNVMNHPQEYAEIPQYVKDDNFVIVTGRGDNGSAQYITIPKGNVIRYVANPTENFISYLAGTNQQTLGEFAAQFLSSGAPVIGDGSSPKEIAIKTIGQNLPQAIKPITENLVNKSFYKYDPKKEQSKDIVPFYMNNKPAGDRSYEFTPVAYKAIGKTLNISPLQVQNALEGYLAGYVKIPVNIIENLNNMATGKEVDRNKLPILRRFIQETYPNPSSNPSVVSFDQAKSGIPSIPNKERSDVLGKASAAEANIDQKKITAEQAKQKQINAQEKQTRDTVKATGQNVVTSKDIYKLKDGKVQKVSISKLEEQTKDTKYQVDANRLKNQNDLLGWLKASDEYAGTLKKKMNSLDPQTEQPEINRLQKKIDTITHTAQGYIDKGGFAKPKKVKKISVGGKGTKTKKGKKASIKVTIPKTKTIKIKQIKPSRVRDYKLPARTIKPTKIKVAKRLTSKR